MSNLHRLHDSHSSTSFESGIGKVILSRFVIFVELLVNFGVTKTLNQYKNLLKIWLVIIFLNKKCFCH